MRESTDGLSSGYPEGRILESYSQILKVCRSAGLSASDADDVSQDIWLWLLRTGTKPIEGAGSWMSAVVHNFVLRHLRKKYRLRFREGLRVCSEATRSRERVDILELKMSLDHLEVRLPDPEADLLRLVRRGFTFGMAANRLGIPHGSHDYHRKRLTNLVEQGLKPGTVLIPNTG